MASLTAPLILLVLVWSWYMDRRFTPLSRFVSLGGVCEVQRGEGGSELLKLRAGHTVTWSQSNLNRRRYAQNDDTLYVAPEDERTDYSQPPMANWYNGVLNTGKRRYGHPALNGVLPLPWLPLKKGQTLVNRERRSGGNKNEEAVVLTLRRRYSVMPMRKASGRLPVRSPLGEYVLNADPQATSAQNDTPKAISTASSGDDLSRNPWKDPSSTEGVQPRSHLRPPRTSERTPLLHHRLSFDDASGVIMLPDEDWTMEDVGSDSDSEDYISSNGRDTPHVPTPGPSRPASAFVAPGEALEDEGAGGSVAVNDTVAEGSAANGAPSPSTSPTRRRHQTYYHHPETRRQTIPGAFPAN